MATEVSVPSALNRADVVQGVFHAWSYDYVVNPNPGDRLRRGLATYLARASVLADARVDQPTIDRAFAAGRPTHRWLPRGLSGDGVQLVYTELSRDGGFTAAEVAQAVAMSRVTARRYLEYFVASGQASVRLAGLGPGRPTKLYRVA